MDKPQARGLFDQERWLPVVGFEGYYEVSDHGRVRRVRKYKNSTADGIIVTSNLVKGYPRVSLSKDNVARNFMVHKLVLDAFHGPRPEGMQCRHLDDVQTNNAASNLRWGTKAENDADKRVNGTNQAGTTNPNANITEAIAGEVARRVARGESSAHIARSTGISVYIVYTIAQGKSWRHVEEVNQLIRSRQCRKSTNRSRA